MQYAKWGRKSLMYHTLERVRKEVERLDMFSGTVVFHSLAGGTGSGIYPLLYPQQIILFILKI